MQPSAALGFRIKSGWARAVLVEAAVPRPRVIERTDLELSDPSIPEARQPYHAATGVAREDSPERERLVATVHAHTRQSVGALVARMATGRRLRGAGLVIGSDIDPARIGNLHVRAHALEGRLFRTAAETALHGHDLPCLMFLERDIVGFGAARLECTVAALKQTLTELGRMVGGSWRSDDKLATLAAWLVLSAPGTRC